MLGYPKGTTFGTMKTFYVYLLASQTRTLYVGVTSNLVRRVGQHRGLRVRGFTSRYRVTRLVHFESTSNALAAIAREKEIKGWSRNKKVNLIEAANPGWEDLAEGWFEE